jgi:hypothetical protein
MLRRFDLPSLEFFSRIVRLMPLVKDGARGSRRPAQQRENDGMILPQIS